VGGEFFVGGGDNNDSLYTEPDFWCKHFEERTAGTKECANLHPPTPPAQNAQSSASGVA